MNALRVLLFAVLVLMPHPALSGAFYGAGAGGGSTVTAAAYASCGAGAAVGDVCVATDSPITMRVWDGLAWDDCIPGYGCADPIPTAGWSALGAATTVSTAGGVRTYTRAASEAIGGHIRTAGSTSFRVEALVSVMGADTTSGGGGIALTLEELATSKALGIQVNVIADGTTLHLDVYGITRPNGAANNTGAVVDPTLTPAVGVDGRLWLAVEYDAADTGAEIDLELSQNGVVWDTILTRPVGTDFTTAPDRYYVGGENSATTHAIDHTWYLIRETDLD